MLSILRNERGAGISLSVIKDMSLFFTEIKQCILPLKRTEGLFATWDAKMYFQP